MISSTQQIFIVGSLIVFSLLQIHWFNIYMDYTLLLIAAFVSAEIVGILDRILDKYYIKLKGFVLLKIKKENDEQA